MEPRSVCGVDQAFIFRLGHSALRDLELIYVLSERVDLVDDDGAAFGLAEHIVLPGAFRIADAVGRFDGSDLLFLPAQGGDGAIVE